MGHHGGQQLYPVAYIVHPPIYVCICMSVCQASVRVQRVLDSAAAAFIADDSISQSEQAAQCQEHGDVNKTGSWSHLADRQSAALLARAKASVAKASFEI